MTCPEINNGCPKLRELNDKKENLDGAGKSLPLGVFNLSNWGISKHDGKYVFSSCLNGSYCAVRK